MIEGREQANSVTPYLVVQQEAGSESTITADYRVDEAIDREFVANTYNHVFPYEELDNWHSYTKRKLLDFVTRNARRIDAAAHILNLGSGGNEYGISARHIHVDVAHLTLRQARRPVVATGEHLPFAGGSLDHAICVGSVLNYCDAAATIRELGRITRPGGLLLLEFESSSSPEYLFTKVFGRHASLSTVWLNSRTERLWLYSEHYIQQLLANASFDVSAVGRFHYLSAIIARFGASDAVCAKWIRFDRFIAKLPFLSRFAANITYVCEKRASAATTTLVAQDRATHRARPRHPLQE